MFENNLKLTEIEKRRIKAYMEKCAENMEKAGSSEKDIITAYYHNKEKAMSRVLIETRPNLRGWWNTREEITFSERIIACVKCKENSSKTESMIKIDGEWNCDKCAKKVFALPPPIIPPYGDKIEI